LGVRLGTNTYPIVEGQYLRDILHQPRALAATLGQLEVPKELDVLAASDPSQEGKCFAEHS